MLIDSFPFFPVALDLAFVVDGSDLVGPDTFKLIIKFIKLIYHVLPVSAKGAHVGLVTFSNIGSVVFNLKKYKTISSLDMAVDQLRLPGGTSNNVGAGLAATHSQMFEASGRKRKQVKKAAVIFLVGKADDDPTVYAKKMKSENIVSIVIAINSDMAPVNLIASSSDHILSINYPAQLFVFVDKVIEMINKGMLLLFTTNILFVSFVTRNFTRFCHLEVNLKCAGLKHKKYTKGNMDSASHRQARTTSHEFM